MKRVTSSRNQPIRLHRRSIGAVALVIALLGSPAIAQNADPWTVYSESLPDRANALKFNIDACVAASRQHADPGSKADWEAAKEPLSDALRQAIGLDPWPEKSPLNAKITGRAERDGYTIENLLFESFPGFYVTANVYVPKNAPTPLPAVVVIAGHAIETGKNYDVYRSGQLGLVRQGMLVLAFDPLGQGERMRKGNGHPLSYPAMVVGHTNLRYMVWDSIRALDYLLTRPDVDPKRIGITGNSGGGLNTMYAMPIEPRFAAGVASCCPCSFEAWIKDGGNHCICNHLPGICQKMEQFQFLGLCASRPLLLTSGRKDTGFPIVGTRSTAHRAARLYGFDGHPERLSLYEAPLAHGWAPPLREATYGWFARWLLERGDGSPIPEPKIVLEDVKSKDLLVLKDGEMPQGAKDYVDLIRAEAQRLVQGYKPVPKAGPEQTAWAAALRTRLWETLGGKPESSRRSAEDHGTFIWEGHSAQRWAIQTEPNLEVPAVIVWPAGDLKPRSAVIMLDAAGKQALKTSPVLKQLLDQGNAVLALDVRATGEGKGKNDGFDNQCASDAVLLGRPLLAQQAWDVIVAARWLAEAQGVEKVAIYGQGPAGLVAVLATALSDDIHAVVAEKTVNSLIDTIADPLPQPQWAYAPNILKVADVPQLAALCAPRPVLRVDDASPESITQFLARPLKKP